MHRWVGLVCHPQHSKGSVDRQLKLQLAINAPFGMLWVADKTYPAVHAFDMSVLAALHAEWLAPMMGIA